MCVCACFFARSFCHSLFQSHWFIVCMVHDFSSLCKQRFNWMQTVNNRRIYNRLLGHYTIPNIFALMPFKKRFEEKFHPSIRYNRRWVFHRLEEIFVFIENWLPCFSHISLWIQAQVEFLFASFILDSLSDSLTFGKLWIQQNHNR